MFLCRNEHFNSLTNHFNNQYTCNPIPFPTPTFFQIHLHTQFKSQQAFSLLQLSVCYLPLFLSHLVLKSELTLWWEFPLQCPYDEEALKNAIFYLIWCIIAGGGFWVLTLHWETRFPTGCWILCCCFSWLLLNQCLYSMLTSLNRARILPLIPKLVAISECFMMH